MSRIAPGVVLAGLVALLAGGVDADERLETHWDVVDAAHAERLDALASQAHKARCYGFRDEVYLRLLHFAPDHEEARRWLKYRRKDGAWVRPGRYRAPNNPGKRHLEGLEAHRAQMRTSWVQSRARLVEEAATLPELTAMEARMLAWESFEPSAAEVPPLLQEVRLRLHDLHRKAGRVGPMQTQRDALVAANPQDADLRARLGEAEHEGAWVLVETVRAHATRTALTAAAERAKERAPAPERVDLDRSEVGVGLANLEAMQSGGMRVAGTRPMKRLGEVARILEGAPAFLGAALSMTPRRRQVTRHYHFAGETDLERFATRFGPQNEAFVKEQLEAELSVLWVDDRIAVDAILPAGQLDLSLGMGFVMLLADTCTENGVLPGWLDEGISRFLVWRYNGTRFAMSVAFRYAGDSTGRTAVAPESDWSKLARAQITEKTPLDLRLLLGKGVDAYTSRDALLAFTFAGYVIEGHPDPCGAFCQALTKGMAPDKAARAHLGDPLSVIGHRFTRWLEEMPES